MWRQCCARWDWSLEFARTAKQPPLVMMVRLAFAGMILALALSLAHAQSADMVLCDRLAADPSDPDKPADVKGVTDIAAADIATAIKYCAVAGKSQRRAMYQLGRAYAANRQTAEAI